MLIQGSFLSSLLNLLPQKGMIKMALTIYAVVATVDKELADCSKEAAGKTIRFK